MILFSAQAILTSRHCGEEPSSHLARQWFPPSEETAQLGQGQLFTMVLCWRWHDAGRKQPTQSSPVKVTALVLWSSLQKLVGGGTVRRRSSSQLWPEHGLKKCLWSCKVGLRSLGAKVEWSAILACTAARAFSLSLLDSRPVGGSGDVVPSVHEVLREACFFLSTGVCCFSCF